MTPPNDEAPEQGMGGIMPTYDAFGIPVNIYELGLIYDIEIAGDGAVKIIMTLTTPGCPVAGILPQQVGDAAAMVPGLGEVEVFLVWDPPWSMERMSEEARLALGMF
jgi:FeS assembly SUF system protein